MTTGIQRIEGRRGHRYKIDGVPADGVTTLIKNGLPKPALMYWSAKSVAEHVADIPDSELQVLRDLGRDGMVAALKSVPWKQRDDAGVRGTDIHKLAERLLHNEDVEVPDPLTGHVEACLRFFDDWQVQPVSIERVVGHRKWRYAGTYDLVADVVRPDTGQTVRALLDWKTAASGIWPETALQLAAYRWAEVYVDTDNTEKPVADLGIEATFGVWLRADGHDVYELDTTEPVFKTFLHVAYVARQIVKDGPMKGWLSDAIQPAHIFEESKS
jgi:hypothetical protein